MFLGLYFAVIVFALLILALLVVLEMWRFSRIDSWYRRFDRGAPWQRRSWFA
jgi:hypothetical protein